MGYIRPSPMNPVLLLSLLLGLPVRAERSIRLEFSADYPASLFHLVDQLSGWQPHSRQPYYFEFWKAQMGLSREDERQLERYRGLRKAYALGIPRPAPELRGPLRRSAHSSGLAEKWALLFGSSRELDEVWDKAQYLLDEGDLARLKGVMEHFDRRFRAHWDRDSDFLRAQLEALRASSALVGAFLDEVAAFYQVDPSFSAVFRTALVWQPDDAFSRGHSKAEHLGRLMVVQVPRRPEYADRLGVIAHEFVHELYRSRSDEVQAELEAALLREHAEHGLLAAQGLNEGLATALGNGEFMRRYRPEEYRRGGGAPNYDNPDVDGYARAVMPIVTRALAKKRTLRDEAGALVVALGARRPRLAAYFREVMAFSEPGFEPVEDALVSALGMGAMWNRGLGAKALEESAAELADHWAQPVVVMAGPRALGSAELAGFDWIMSEAALSGLRRRAERAPLAYCARSRKGRLYLLLLGERDALAAGLPRLADQPPCGEGALISLVDGRRSSL